MPLGAKDAEFRRVAISTRPIQRKGLRVTELLLLMGDKPCRLCDTVKPHKAGFSLRAFIYKGSRGSILTFTRGVLGMILINSDTKEPVNIGDTVTSFRGEKSIVLGMSEPRHSGSTGRIRVEGREFFPSVFNCEWKMS